MTLIGHCWSNEAFYPPLRTKSALHPSHEPKCTHGYALSPEGARRLVSYLTHPHFAFSRAIDQAISHLVLTGRLRAFSVVPAIVKQQRCDDRPQGIGTNCKEDSDIRLEAGKVGAWWKDALEDSAMVRIEKEMFDS